MNINQIADGIRDRNRRRYRQGGDDEDEIHAV